MQGQFAGTFFSILESNQFIGNLLVALLFSFKARVTSIIICAAAVALLGSLLLTRLPVLPAISVAPADASVGPRAHRPPLCVLMHPQFCLLVPLTLYWGAQLAFITGVFPLFCDSLLHKFFALGRSSPLRVTCCVITVGGGGMLCRRRSFAH